MMIWRWIGKTFMQVFKNLGVGVDIDSNHINIC